MDKKVEQAVWQGRNEQVNFAMHISDLLLKNFGRIFNSKYQGAGKIASLVITGHGINPKKMDEIRKFLIQKYGLKLHRINGHGHTVGTIVVHICEISLASQKKVEEDFRNVIIGSEVSKRIVNKTLSEKQKSFDSIIEKVDENLPLYAADMIENNEITKTNTTTMETFSIIKKGRALISNFLTVMFRFEGIISSDKKDKIFSFNEKKNDDVQIISFRNEVETDMSFKALTWYYGGTNPKECPIQEGNEVWVNFFSLDVIKKRPIYINFTLAPLKGENLKQIGRRINHVMTGYYTSVLEIVNNDCFKIAYARVSTTTRFFELIVGMGWIAEMKDDVIICSFRANDKVSSFIESSIESPIISSPESSVPTVDVKPVSIKDLFSQAEAILIIRDIYNDIKRWNAISPDKKRKILIILRNELKNSSNPNELAKYLLESDFGERSLFSKEEAIREFKSMMASPDFKVAYSIEIQNRIITAMKDNMSDEELLDSILDFF